MVEYFSSAIVMECGYVGAGLFVEPPRWQRHRLSDVTRFLQDHAVWDEGGIDITGHAVRVVGKRHGGPSNDEEVGNYSASNESVAEGGERSLKLAASKEAVVTHAASRSRAER